MLFLLLHPIFCKTCLSTLSSSASFSSPANLIEDINLVNTEKVKVMTIWCCCFHLVLQTENLLCKQKTPNYHLHGLFSDQMSKVERNLTFARRGNLGMMKNNGFVKLNLYCLLSRLIACKSILSGSVLSSANWITLWLCKWSRLTLVTGIIYMDRTDRYQTNLPARLAMPGVFRRQL